MHHVDTKVILGVNISAVIDEQLAHLRIPLERSEVERREAITMIFHIEPSGKLLLSQLALSVLNQES